DDEARSCRVVVEQAEDARRWKLEADLFHELTQRGCLRRLAAIEAAAGEGPLSAVVAKPRRAACEDEAGATDFVGEQRQRHGRGAQALGRAGLAPEPTEVAPHQRTQLVRHGVELGSRARHAPRPFRGELWLSIPRDALSAPHAPRSMPRAARSAP